VVGNLEHGFLVAVLVSSMAGEDSRDVEDDGSLFVGERVLRGGLVSKGVEPGEGDLDVILINGKAQI